VANRRTRIGLLTGGGDCPGLNAAIRAVVKAARIECGCEVLGIENGFRGLVEDQTTPLNHEAIRGILAVGGTVLGTTNRADPFHYLCPDGSERDLSRQALDNAARLGLDALIVIGGDGSLRIAGQLGDMGLPVIGVPKTIDRDVMGTDETIGFDTARSICVDAVDRLDSTAEAHDRVMVLEVMGRDSGFLALDAAIAGGADAVLIPEIPWDAGSLVETIRNRRGRGRVHGVVVVAEGARRTGGAVSVQQARIPGRGEVKLGGAGTVAADAIAEEVELEVRVTNLGHLQRGGAPSAADRILAARFGVAAARLAAARARNRFVALRNGAVMDVPLGEAQGRRRVDPRGELTHMARSLGISFGEKV
jgi:ATP-dependent phosphofructokinase / diphosphate-dependent phosphofructokinase